MCNIFGNNEATFTNECNFKPQNNKLVTFFFKKKDICMCILQFVK